MTDSPGLNTSLEEITRSKPDNCLHSSSNTFVRASIFSPLYKPAADFGLFIGVWMTTTRQICRRVNSVQNTRRGCVMGKTYRA